MFSSKNKRKIIYIICGILIVTGISVEAMKKNSIYAENLLQLRNISLAKNYLSQITQLQFGELQYKDFSNLGGHKFIIFNDNMYDYKVSADTGKLATVQMRAYDKKNNVPGEISKEALYKIAAGVLKKYNPIDSKNKYVLVDEHQKNTDNEKYYSYIYEEVASNGIKTGTGVAFDINNAGELLGLAIHQGNPKIAEEVKPKLSKDDAVKIAGNYIKSQSSFKNIMQLPADNSELTVWNDRLVWKVDVNNINVGNSECGFHFMIDALTGDILLDEPYTALRS